LRAVLIPQPSFFMTSRNPLSPRSRFCASTLIAGASLLLLVACGGRTPVGFDEDGNLIVPPEGTGGGAGATGGSGGATGGTGGATGGSGGATGGSGGATGGSGGATGGSGGATGGTGGATGGTGGGSAVCGNAILEPGEACDSGLHSCCNEFCNGPQRAGTECRASSESCDAAEFCDGINVECGPDGAAPVGTPISHCAYEDLGRAVPNTVRSSNARGCDEFTPSCVAGGGNEVVYTFVAPQSANYTFSTLGSGFDTSLMLLEGLFCGARELDCDDDGGAGLDSLLRVGLAAGEEVTLAVDSFNGGTGNIVLEVTSDAPQDICASHCAFTDMGSNTTASGSNRNTCNVYRGSCGSESGNEALFRFTAPAAGEYRFNTDGSNYDTVLYALDSATCGRELQCNDDTRGLQSEVILNLAAGEAVVLAVGGFSGSQGDIRLNVETPTCALGHCQFTDLGARSPLTVIGSTTNACNVYSGGCGNEVGDEVVFLFSAPRTARYTFDTVGSDFDTVLYAMDSRTCGPALVCNDDTIGVQSEITLSMTAGESRLLVVGGYNGQEGRFVLNVED